MKKNNYLAIAICVVVALGLMFYMILNPGKSKEETPAVENIKPSTVQIENNYTIRSEEQGAEATEVNETVEVPVDPKKVVVYDLGALDTIAALGKEASVVAIPKGQNANNMLTEANKALFDREDVEDAGSLFEPNFETIASIEPDVIILSGRSATPKNIEEFKKAAPNAVLVYGSADTTNGLTTGVKEKVTMFGKIYDVEDKAEEINQQLDDAVAEVKDLVAAKEDASALFVMANGGELLSQSPTGRFGWVFQELGFKAVNEGEQASQHGNQVSFEYLVETDPAYLFVLDRGATIGQGDTATAILENDVLAGTTAIQNNQVLQVNGKNWYLNTGGAKVTLEMIEEIKTFIEK